MRVANNRRGTPVLTEGSFNYIGIYLECRIERLAFGDGLDMLEIEGAAVTIGCRREIAGTITEKKCTTS